MDANFNRRISSLPITLRTLLECQAVDRNNLKGTPVRGVYLFLENNQPIYVGRTNRMRARLQEHGRLSAGHNDASFAFRLAKAAASVNGINTNRKRSELANDPEFAIHFLSEKRRVSEMRIKYVEISDPVDQYLFEVYASEVLQTPHNDFENH